MEKARYNIDRLWPFKAIITGCASCLHRLQDYRELFAENDPYRARADELGAKCYDVSQYLNGRDIEYSLFDSGREIRVTYHNPCHLRAAGWHREPQKLLQKIRNVKIIEPQHADRCCGQAGSYGFVHFQEGKKIFQKKKDDYLGLEAEYLATSCPACQMKIRAEMGAKFKVVHPVEILALGLRKE